MTLGQRGKRKDRSIGQHADWLFYAKWMIEAWKNQAIVKKVQAGTKVLWKSEEHIAMKASFLLSPARMACYRLGVSFRKSVSSMLLICNYHSVVHRAQYLDAALKMFWK